MKEKMFAFHKVVEQPPPVQSVAFDRTTREKVQSGGHRAKAGIWFVISRLRAAARTPEAVLRDEKSSVRRENRYTELPLREQQESESGARGQ